MERDGVAVLPPMDVFESLALLHEAGVRAQAVMLDPWYNKGVGGIDPDYDDYVVRLFDAAGALGSHVFFWGFPEIVATFVDRWPDDLSLVAWLTWFYKNNPSVIRGWRSAQMTCLHLAREDAALHPEHFLNDRQLALMDQGRLRYVPGPTSVIEAALNIGFIGRSEQTGHPAQKPVKVYEPLVRMTTVEGELVVDPLAGSGTTGAATRQLGRRAILSDRSEEYTALMERRLGVTRLEL